MLYRQDGRLCYSNDGETLCIEAWGRNALRVRSSMLVQPSAEDWALLEPNVRVDAEITLAETYATIRNGGITAVLDSHGVLGFFNREGKTLLEEYARNRKGFDIVPGRVEPGHRLSSAQEVDARVFHPIPGGDYSLTLRFESVLEEHLYGMGQYQQPFLNLKGCELELAQRNSQVSVPFLVSSLGYGFLWNNPAIGRVTFAKNVTTWYAEATKALDYWITSADTPAQIVEQYASVTGTVPVMPDWAMGYWQCKLRYQTQEELIDVAREYKRRSIPLSVIIVDYFHWPMQGEWMFDPDYWPDPQALVDELEKMGVKLMVSVWPNVDHRSENYAEMLEKGYLIHMDRGQRIAMNFMGNTVPFDATNPKARKYVWEKVRKHYYRYGIHAFWLDESEPEYTYYDFDIYRYALGTDLQIGNIYPKLYAKGFYDGMTAEGQQNVLNLIRSAWAGSQRYGTLVWSGDIESSFASLRNQLAAGLNIGMAGIPWWTTDIGGFHGGSPDDPAFRECFVRWFQWATFCPVMRSHGSREPHKPPLSDKDYGGGACDSGADNEVWSYGKEIYGICRNFIRIREQMHTYIKGLMNAAHEHGSPVMRPLFYDAPEDPTAWKIEDEYMFGSELLVAPILYAQQRQRDVYLPSSNRWRNLWNGEMLEGGQTYVVQAPLSQIPLFAREISELSIK